MKNNRKFGFLLLGAWIVFFFSVIGGYAAYHHVPFLEYYLDEETGGFISGLFFLVGAVVWYLLGAHEGRSYEATVKVLQDKYPDVESSELKKLIRTYYLTKRAKLLTAFFAVSVPWWWIVNMATGKSPRLLDYIATGLLMILSIITYWYYNRHKSVLES